MCYTLDWIGVSWDDVALHCDAFVLYSLVFLFATNLITIFA
jgi:hypothetical protein